MVALLVWLAGLVAMLLPPTARANEAAAWAALRQGGSIALIRHAEAPGVGDPAGWRLDDCSTQRNLNEAGRADARALGARLRAERIPVARLLSSPWCRCLETARLMNLGPPVQTEAAFSNAFVLNDQRDGLVERGRAVLAAWQGPGVLVVVTHGVNIQALSGYSPGTGEVVVLRRAADGSLQRVGAVSAAAAGR